MSEAKNLKSFWNNHAKNWESSGLTKREYCKREELSFNSFVYFRRLYLKQTIVSSKPSFIDAGHLTSTTSPTNAVLVMQISLPSGARIGLSAYAPEEM